MRDRIFKVIDRTFSPSKKFAELEKMTGIKATSWKKAYVGGQRPTIEMVEAICKMNQECVLWITCGKTDEANNQYDVDTKIAISKYGYGDVLNTSPGQWSTDHFLVAEAELKKRRAGKTVEQPNDGIEDLIEQYKKLLKLQAQHAVDTDVKQVRVWRDEEGAHCSIEHTISLRNSEPYPDFEWGYHGTGPRELAANVLFFFGGKEDEAKHLATAFSQDVIASLAHQEDAVDEVEYSRWMRRRGLGVLQSANFKMDGESS